MKWLFLLNYVTHVVLMWIVTAMILNFDEFESEQFIRQYGKFAEEEKDVQYVARINGGISQCESNIDYMWSKGLLAKCTSIGSDDTQSHMHLKATSIEMPDIDTRTLKSTLQGRNLHVHDVFSLGENELFFSSTELKGIKLRVDEQPGVKCLSIVSHDTGYDFLLDVPIIFDALPTIIQRNKHLNTSAFTHSCEDGSPISESSFSITQLSESFVLSLEDPNIPNAYSIGPYQSTTLFCITYSANVHSTYTIYMTLTNRCERTNEVYSRRTIPLYKKWVFYD